MSRISIEDVSLRFRSYGNHASTLKEYFAGLFKRRPALAAPSPEFTALRSVNLTIEAGERVGIIGHNGAGKSTFLKVLCRIYEPTTGRVVVTGRIAPLLEIGAGFHPEFTGRENIYMNGAILGHTRKQLAVIEPEVIEFAELQDFIDTPVKYYSTGMYMRLAFALATAVQPDILILDEMFAGGDASFVERAQARMRRMIDHANIMLLVSHDLSLLSNFCERVIWFDHGGIKRDGPAKEVIAEYQSGHSGHALAAA